MTKPTNMSLDGITTWAEGVGNPPANNQRINADTVDDMHVADIIAAATSGVGALNDLSDVDLTSPSEGQVLTCNSAGEWVNQAAASGGAQALNDLSDVDTDIYGPPVAADSLVYASGYGWVNGKLDLHHASDVTISSPSEGQVLTYTSGEWKNQDAPESGMTIVGAGGQAAMLTAGWKLTVMPGYKAWHGNDSTAPYTGMTEMTGYQTTTGVALAYRFVGTVSNSPTFRVSYEYSGEMHDIAATAVVINGATRYVIPMQTGGRFWVIST